MRTVPYLRLLLLLALLASFAGLIVWLIQSFLDLYYATRYHPILGGAVDRGAGVAAAAVFGRFHLLLVSVPPRP